MAEKVSQTVRILMEIRDDIREMKGDIHGMKGAIHTLSERIDHMLVGPHRDDHVELRRRVERLEQHTGLARWPG